MSENKDTENEKNSNNNKISQKNPEVKHYQKNMNNSSQRREEEKNKITDDINKVPLTTNNLESKSSSTDIKTNEDKKDSQPIKKTIDVKTKVKPVKEIPIEKKPFDEFINEHLLPEIKKSLNSIGKEVVEINIKNTERPIAGDKCWVIYCEVKETCNFWLSFEKNDILSSKSFSLCKNYEKPSIIESFLIDEKKITLKLIISRILQRLNGQKLIGAN
tara:strand:+ start:303 stop:953 length:651 start_codon:yes stop_codon:yes gene_type:complete